MSRVVSTIRRAPVEIPERPHLSKSARQRVWERAKGTCWLCTKAVPMEGPEVQYDHRNQRSVSGDDSEANIWPMHAEPCHRLKTAADAETRAKVKRLIVKNGPPELRPKAQKISGPQFRSRWDR